VNIENREKRVNLCASSGVRPDYDNLTISGGYDHVGVVRRLTFGIAEKITERDRRKHADHSESAAHDTYPKQPHQATNRDNS
jgi:hypothetical protein